jgi:hypothetical protein
MHLPSLESVWLDGTTCIVMSDQECHEHARIVCKATPCPRRMNVKLRFMGHPAMTELPTWFVSRTYLSLIEELGLDTRNQALFLSSWQIAIKSSSSLTHLTFTIPDYNIPSSDKRLACLVCLSLTDLRLVGGWGHRYNATGITMVLDSIAPGTITRTLRLDSVEHWSTGSYDPMMTFFDHHRLGRHTHSQVSLPATCWYPSEMGDMCRSRFSG